LAAIKAVTNPDEASRSVLDLARKIAPDNNRIRHER
jgi:hypothetical protein